MQSLLKNIWLKYIQTCVFCAKPDKNNICANCIADLPWLTHTCTICALPLLSTATHLICKNCIQQKPRFNRVIAAFNYSFPIDVAVTKSKKEQARHHLNWLSYLLLTKLAGGYSSSSMPEVIIPVPISAKKKLYKGYNQTEQLAKAISGRLNIAYDDHVLTKIKDTPAQATLSAKQRKTNLIGAFSAHKHPYLHVAIVDDVLTTGSTANELAKVLKDSGAKTIDIWVIARTPI
ncbi:ComF family protein [Gammaproteobacteria bacterium AS21]|jgi:ComF family protein